MMDHKLSRILTLALIAASQLWMAGVRASVIEPGVAWDEKNRPVKVCFAEDRHRNSTDIDQRSGKQLSLQLWTAHKQEQVRDLVTTNFSMGVTGIEFIGWKKCRDDEDLKVVRLFIFSDTGRDGGSTVGELGVLENSCSGDQDVVDLVKDLHSMKAPYFAVWANPIEDSDFPCAVLHEFGHIAGLRHEHIRPEVEMDSKCKLYNKSEKMFHSTELVGEYDPISIMSYCRKYYLPQFSKSCFPRLSNGDIRALRSLYKVD